MPTEIKVLADNLGIRERTLVLLAVSTGLRQSELFGLKWGDIDFGQRTMNVTRSIVYGFVGPCKTESSQKPVPVHPLLAESLLKWRKHCVATKLDDWVFASRRTRGRKPYWGQAILRKYVRPVAEKVGIQKCLAHVPSHIFDFVENRGYRVQSHAGTVATFNAAIHVRCLHAGNHAGQTCSPGSRLVTGVPGRANGTSQSPSSANAAA